MRNLLPDGFFASQDSHWLYDSATQRITVVARPQSDIYIDPASHSSGSQIAPRHDAVTLMTYAPSGDFQFSATVNVDFQDTFDAGVLMVRLNPRVWAKFCFEFSPDGEAMVVSVVNKGETSDDVNSFVVSGREVSLRISRKGNVYAFHAAVEHDKWIFVRAFAFDSEQDALSEKMEVGLQAQSPVGKGCKVEFSNVSLTPTTINDFRDGK